MPATKQKHTPGEWFRVDRRYQDDERPRIEICTFRDDGTPDQRIATIHDCTINPLEEHTGEVEANARLIAAAPDLLAALQRLCDARVVEVSEEFADARIAARSAIRRAEGGKT